MFDPTKFVSELHEYIGRVVAPLVDRVKALEAIPTTNTGPGSAPIKGDKGDPGIDGKDGRDGIDGKDGAPGRPGDPGCNGADAVIEMEMVEQALERIVDRSIAKYALDFEIRAGKAMQSAIERLPLPKDGRDGIDGKDGIDGASMEGLTMEYDPQAHEVVLRAGVAGRKVELRYFAGGIRPGGYWREGTKALAGQTWTHDGTMWIALKDTTEQPSIQSVDWYIGARKGRDSESRERKAPGPHKPVKI